MLGIRTSPRAIIERDGRYLVACYRAGHGEWCIFPGGGQVHGEDLHEALRREIREESGAEIQVGPLRFVRECVAARFPGPGLPPDFHQVELYFDCELLSEVKSLGAAPDPHQVGFAWRTAEELRGLTFFPAGMLDAMEAGGPAYLGAIP